MQVQTIFKTGNSDVVTIPSDYVKNYGYHSGVKVRVVPVGNGDSLILEKVKKVNISKTSQKVSQEFNKWLKG
ncbi:MAG: hypothetical protein U0946_03250, partial [Patescibacteria group bacterium]|nr:hypothetical protein [Patescibacteria group bacterium]